MLLIFQKYNMTFFFDVIFWNLFEFLHIIPLKNIKILIIVLLCQQGLIFPSANLMIAAWIPPKDKAKYWSLIASGNLIFM